MIGDDGQHACQVRLGIDAIQFCGAKKAVEGGRPLTALV